MGLLSGRAPRLAALACCEFQAESIGNEPLPSRQLGWIEVRLRYAIQMCQVRNVIGQQCCRTYPAVHGKGACRDWLMSVSIHNHQGRDYQVYGDCWMLTGYHAECPGPKTAKNAS